MRASPSSVGAITSFSRLRPSGWPVTMHVVGLGAGALLVHSPTWVDDGVAERLRALGRPSILLAPNHYHHLHLARFREQFPDALAVASAGAIPRLERLGHRGLWSTDDVTLPAGVRWLVPEGTLTGEAWVAVDGDDGVTWIVCDAFFHQTAPLRGAEGAFLRLAKIAPGLCIGATFTWLGIRDRSRYRSWVLEAVARDRPRRARFSHGQPIEQRAADEIVAVMRRRLG